MGIVPRNYQNKKPKPGTENYMSNLSEKKAINWIIKGSKKVPKKAVKKCLMPNPKRNCECGISEVDERKEKEVHPWQVLLYIFWGEKANAPILNKRPKCLGVLISKKHILTAYHCLQKRGNKVL